MASQVECPAGLLTLGLAIGLALDNGISEDMKHEEA